LVSAASSGAVSVSAALAGDARLGDLGLDSLGLLRLVDAVEVEYGVELDLAGGAGFSTVDAIVAEIAAATGGQR
jgi:acyl carrier protein